MSLDTHLDSVSLSEERRQQSPYLKIAMGLKCLAIHLLQGTPWFSNYIVMGSVLINRAVHAGFEELLALETWRKWSQTLKTTHNQSYVTLGLFLYTQGLLWIISQVPQRWQSAPGASAYPAAPPLLLQGNLLSGGQPLWKPPLPCSAHAPDTAVALPVAIPALER